MKMYQIKCIHCGAPIDVEQDRKSVFCSYCGNKMLVDDETEKIEINYTSTQRIVDEAKIKELELKLKQFESSERAKSISIKSVLKGILIFFIIVAALVLLTVGIALMYRVGGSSQELGENDVRIYSSATSYLYKNYKSVQLELEDLGFTNIELVPIEDLTSSLETRLDGMIERISIDGRTNFNSGAIFQKDSHVVITYHTFKPTGTDDT